MTYEAQERGRSSGSLRCALRLAACCFFLGGWGEARAERPLIRFLISPSASSEPLLLTQLEQEIGDLSISLGDLVDCSTDSPEAGDVEPVQLEFSRLYIDDRTLWAQGQFTAPGQPGEAFEVPCKDCLTSSDDPSAVRRAHFAVILKRLLAETVFHHAKGLFGPYLVRSCEVERGLRFRVGLVSGSQKEPAIHLSYPLRVIENKKLGGHRYWTRTSYIFKVEEWAEDQQGWQGTLSFWPDTRLQRRGFGSSCGRPEDFSDERYLLALHYKKDTKPPEAEDPVATGDYGLGRALGMKSDGR